MASAGRGGARGRGRGRGGRTWAAGPVIPGATLYESSSLFPTELPATYPKDAEIIPPLEMDDDERRTLQLGRYLLNSLRVAGFQPREQTVEKRDVERYSDVYVEKESTASAMEDFRRAGDLDLFPEEIRKGQKRVANFDLGAQNNLDWEKLEKEEGKFSSQQNQAGEDADEEEEPDNEDLDDDQVDDDYVDNYFDNGEGDGDDGDVDEGPMM